MLSGSIEFEVVDARFAAKSRLRRVDGLNARIGRISGRSCVLPVEDREDFADVSGGGGGWSWAMDATQS